MRTLVLGGIRSGKSRWAEGAVTHGAGDGAPVRYLATGPAADSDPAWAHRVGIHQARRPAHWRTVETCDLVTALTAGPHAPNAATLVDDIGGWLTATMDRLGAWTGGSVGPEVDTLVRAVDAFTAPLVLVSPEVGLTVVPATEAGRRFADELGTVNQRLAAVCDRVVLVVAGQPLTVKEPS